MASVACQLIEEVTAHVQSNTLEDARQICADGSYFPNNLGLCICIYNTLFLLNKWDIIKLGGLQNTLIKIPWP